jgi:hypothetical protein
MGRSYDIPSNTVRALNPATNSFCAAGVHLSNGTIINTGENNTAPSHDKT